jgi:hypothetical protein
LDNWHHCCFQIILCNSMQLFKFAVSHGL